MEEYRESSELSQAPCEEVQVWMDELQGNEMQAASARKAFNDGREDLHEVISPHWDNSVAPQQSQGVEVHHRHWSKLCRRIHWPTSREEKLMVRDFLVTVVSLALPFLESVQNVAKGSELLIPIICLALALTPATATAVGQEAGMFLNLVVSLPITYVIAALLVQHGHHSLLLVMLFFSAVVFGIIWVAFSFPSYILPGVVNSIVFSFTVPKLYALYHFPSANSTNTVTTSPEELLLGYIGALLFSSMVPLLLHFVGAVAIFPWFSHEATIEAMKKRLVIDATLAAKLRQVYHQIGCYTMFPEHQTQYLGLSMEQLETLGKLKDEEGACSVAVHATIIPTLFETRWRFDGTGYLLLELHKLMTDLARHLRSAAEDVVVQTEWMVEFERQHPERANSALEKEQELNVAFIESCTDPQAEISRRQELLGHVHALNALVEDSLKHLLVWLNYTNVGMWPAAGGDKETLVQAIQANQGRMEETCRVVEEMFLLWVKGYIQQQVSQYGAGTGGREALDDPMKRTRFTTYVLTFKSLVQSHAALVDFVAAECKGGLSKIVAVNQRDMAKEEWKMSLMNRVSTMEGTSLRKYKVELGWLRRPVAWYDSLSHLACQPPFRMAVKFTLGTSLLNLLACLPSTHRSFTEVNLVNAVFTFQTILYILQKGLVIERTVLRLGGIVCAYFYAGIAWELSCVSGCWALDGWSLFLLELPALMLYIWVLRYNSIRGYAGFAFVRTYSTMTAPLVAILKEQDPVPAHAFWTYSGFIVLSSFLGAALALLLGLGLWPTSGRSSLRAMLANVYKDFLLLSEGVFYSRLKRLSEGSADTRSLELAESNLSRTLWIDTAPLLRAAQLESMQKVNFDASYEQYVSMVNSTKALWRSLWKMHHLGGLAMFLRDSQGRPLQAVSPVVARNMIAMNRQLDTAFALISSTLRGDRFTPLPVLRPVIATPKLLKELVDDYLVLCFQDQGLLRLLMDSQDLHLTAKLLLFRDILMECSIALRKVFDFLENFLYEPVLREGLRAEDQVSLRVYSL